jgi:hypothetical protein
MSMMNVLLGIEVWAENWVRCMLIVPSMALMAVRRVLFH